MRFTVFRTYQGKRVLHWPELVLFLLLAGLAGAMTCFLLILTAENLGLALDFLDYSPLLISGSAVLFMALASLVSFWLRRSTPGNESQELEAPPNPLFSLTADS